MCGVALTLYWFPWRGCLLYTSDEYYRHCITKMAALHFPSCAESAARLVRMGEAPETVFCVGGLRCV